MFINDRTSRILDLLLTVMLLPAIVSGFVIIGIVLFLADNSSSIFFVQERIGKRGVPFRIYKFRTLKNNRCACRFAYFLRQTGLDEIPQIVNIIKGEMQFFGPRPKLHHEIPQIHQERYRKLVLKRRPGLFSLYIAEKGPGQSVRLTREDSEKEIAKILAYERYEQMHRSAKLTGIIFFRCFRKIVENRMAVS